VVSTTPTGIISFCIDSLPHCGQRTNAPDWGTGAATPSTVATRLRPNVRISRTIVVVVASLVAAASTPVTASAATKKTTKTTTKTTTTTSGTAKAKTTYPVQLDVIEASLTKSQQAASPSLKVDKATCDRVTKAPAGKTVIKCEVRVEGTAVPYRVVLEMSSNGSGSFTSKATKVPIDTRTLQALVRSVLNADASDDAVVDCGKQRIVVVDPGAVLRCSATLGDEKERFSFVVKDMAGNVEMQR
jgi:hypothetical protein